MQRFSLRVNFLFFSQIVKGGKKTQPFGYFYFFFKGTKIENRNVLVAHIFGTLTKTFIGHYEA